ncbi:hypothetical protein ACFPYJ_25080 [Paenibacillus solisilvae]|uniref:DUF4309 domain-containing protein n=1 Tax=Paenibacillus solisilvae TaxID=2486751 RepID=A0ABW0W2D0_9BACL
MKRRAIGVSVAIIGLLAFISTAYAGSNGYEPVVKAPDTITAFINDIDHTNGKVTLQADDIEWYEGKEADKMFLEREPDSGLDGSPDGYYIINDDKRVKTLEVDPHAVVVMQIYDHTGNIYDITTEWDQAIPLAKFEAIYDKKDVLDVSEYPYHLTIKDGKVVKIVQQYIP